MSSFSNNPNPNNPGQSVAAGVADSLVVRQFERVRCALRGLARIAPEHERLITLSAKALDATDGGAAGGMTGTIVDLSRGGLGIRTKVFIPKQTRLIVQITDPTLGGTSDSPVLTAEVRVMRVIMVDRTPTYELGTAFIDTGTSFKATVADIIRRASELQQGGRASA
jgi:hypothetical protein